MFRQFFIVLLIVAQSGEANSRPVIEGGREAEIRALFADVGRGALAGWKVARISIPRDRIRPVLAGPRGQVVVLEFRYPAGRDDRFRQGWVSRIAQFDVYIYGRTGIDEAAAVRVAKEVARGVDRRARPRFWRSTGRLAGNGYTPSTLATRLSLRHAMSSVYGIVFVGWLAGLLALLTLVAIFLAKRRPWNEQENRRVMLEILIIFSVALLVRQVLTFNGPANFYNPLDPSRRGWGLPFLGPGHIAWVMAWFAVLGAGDQVVFLAGSIAGALTVVPAYILGWLGLDKREFGFAAAIAAALWPVHVRFSPTDDSAVLVSLLLLSALALLAAAERTSSALLLCGGWLSGLLAATTRPEYALALPVLGFWVFWSPKLRRVQLKAPALVATILLGVVGGTLLVLTVYTTISTFGYPFYMRNVGLGELGHLIGYEGVSIFLPPATPYVLTGFFLVGLFAATRITRGRAVFYLLAAALPAVPSAELANQSFVTFRYQLALATVGAILAGVGAVWCALHVHKRWAALWPAVIVLPACFLMWPLVSPPAEPTFRLEYAFFRAHIRSIPRDCSIVRLAWKADVGLRPPEYLSIYYDLRHVWIRPKKNLNVDKECVVYWRPAACYVKPHDAQSYRMNYQPDCRSFEASYRLQPLATTRIPARRGYKETYVRDPVQVGFYQLLPKPAPDR